MAPEHRVNGKRTGKHPADSGSKWLSIKKRQLIYQRDDWRCVYCGKEMKVLVTDYEFPISGEKVAKVITPDGFTIDHLVPTELGGTNEARNLVTACKTCNSSKGAKSTNQFLSWLEFTKKIDIIKVKNRIKRQTRRKLKGYKERVNGKR